MTSSSNIQISLAVLAEIIQYDLSQPGRETAGLLIGQEIEIDNTVHIDEIRVGEQKGNAVHVVISDEELTKAAIEVSQREDGKVIVGWWHTHPGLSAFLSGTDIRTQTLYQAFMPNAVAIVIDDVKYSKTLQINDLDIGVFRVINGKTSRMTYSIKDSVEFGLNTYIARDSPIIKASQEPIKIYSSVLSYEDLMFMKSKINTYTDQMNPSDIAALKAWIELTESMQNGAIQEVPIDVATLRDHLDSSLDQIDDTLLSIEELMLNKQAQNGLMAIFIGIIIELFVFYMLVTG